MIFTYSKMYIKACGTEILAEGVCVCISWKTLTFFYIVHLDKAGEKEV